MPKAVRIWSTTPVSKSSAHSRSHQLVAMTLFSGIGLLISLVAVLAGLQGVWQ